MIKNTNMCQQPLLLKVHIVNVSVCHAICSNYSTPPLWSKRSHRPHVNEWVWLCSNKILFIKTDCRTDLTVARQIARRNINNLRYADDTTLMEESEEELKSLLRKVKEGSEKLA